MPTTSDKSLQLPLGKSAHVARQRPCNLLFTVALAIAEPDTWRKLAKA